MQRVAVIPVTELFVDAFFFIHAGADLTGRLVVIPGLVGSIIATATIPQMNGSTVIPAALPFFMQTFAFVFGVANVASVWLINPCLPGCWSLVARIQIYRVAVGPTGIFQMKAHT